jgi:hypothetical protein
MRHNSLIWGVILLLLGGLMLADAMGIRLPNGSSLTSLFWPFILIVFGVWALVSAFWKNDVKTESANILLDGASEAKLRIHHGAGELKVHSGANSNELMHGTFTGRMEHSASRDGNKIEAKIRSAAHFFDFPFFSLRTESQFHYDLMSAQINLLSPCVI